MAKTSDFNEERCDTLVASAIEGLRPTRLNIDSELPTALSTLNQWMSECGKAAEKPQEISPVALELLKAVATPQQLEHLNDERFSSRDGIHVRDCLLAKKVTEFATASADNSLDRVVDLFEYVTRNVDLYQPSEKSPPTTMFTAFFFGQGTPQDRALIFASLLRQLGIDAVILRPRTAETADEKAAERQWLVGVLLDGAVYLFDMRLGTPIPSAADTGKTVTVRKPATLAEVQQNDALLRALDLPGGRTYPLRAENLAALRVEIIGSTSLWSPRLERLQSVLVGDRYLIVYDPLEDHGKNPGLLRRVVEAGTGHWQQSDVAVWPYPELALQRFEKRTLDQQMAYEFKQRPFQAPITFVFDGAGGVVLDANTRTARMGQAKAEHHRARVNQLVGNYDAAIHRYTEARIDERFPPGIAVYAEHRLAHESAADNSTFWNAVCLMEQDQSGAAVVGFRNYLRRHQKAPEKGPWVGFCRGLLALGLAKSGNYEGAVSELTPLPATDPKKDGYDFFAQRWKKLQSLKPEKSTDEKTVGDAPSQTQQSPAPPTGASPATQKATEQPDAESPKKNP
ncbi:MAG: transglutaminase-like domain-containing protein [Planctomycetaceae bacterium]